MTTRRTDSEKVERYTQMLLDAARAEGRSALDLQQLRHAVKFSPEIIETIALMDNANEDYLIDQVYRELKERMDNGDLTISVDVTTAVPLGDELRAAVREKCEHDFDRPVYLVEHVEPKILGGIIIEARGHRRDASVRTHLANIRRSLLTSYVGGDE